MAGKKSAVTDRVQAGMKTGSGPAWQQTVGLYIAGQEHVDEMDAVVIEMERKWGVGRLRLLVGTDLAEKFDRQRYLTNQAIWYGDLEQIKRETKRMISAYRALDRAAEEAGKQTVSAEIWEVPLPSGEVVALVRDNVEAHAVLAEGRSVIVYTLEEIGRMIHSSREILTAKKVFPGAEVTAIRMAIADPLNAVPDSIGSLDDPMEDMSIPWNTV